MVEFFADVVDISYGCVSRYVINAGDDCNERDGEKYIFSKKSTI